MRWVENTTDPDDLPLEFCYDELESYIDTYIIETKDLAKTKIKIDN
jgi:hypothetical protein